MNDNPNIPWMVKRLFRKSIRIAAAKTLQNKLFGDDWKSTAQVFASSAYVERRLNEPREKCCRMRSIKFAFVMSGTF
ncbi:hypothetical protein EC9_38550 [Rosistilla ulvae]|uniref:Uncharacterized protein n=1 Tax=Rosistilla ulvae TaxID=1930277 RepID=A0A517M442_9BACT|nr:hypothetical protein [Rosistilla ulvae]QDS89655.1 hypothetical protein EC9_38550 [Rosistilla ulvae]